MTLRQRSRASYELLRVTATYALARWRIDTLQVARVAALWCCFTVLSLLVPLAWRALAIFGAWVVGAALARELWWTP